MLATFRALAKSPLVIGLLVILVASFLLWSIRDVFRYTGGGGDAVIQAGSRSIGAARFRQMFDDELKSAGQQTGQTVSAQDAIRNNLDREVADALASEEAFAELIRRSGVRPSDKLVVDEIRKAPRFFNPVSGAFDRQAYEQFVQQVGMSDAEFEAILRDELAQAQFVSGVAAGLRPPRLYDALVAAAQGDGRTFAYFTLPITAVPPPPKPTDAQLGQIIKQFGDRLKRPEMRQLTLLQFSTSAAGAAITADAAAVQKRFEFEKDALSTPEKRSLIQIPARNGAAAAAAAARLRQGQDANAVARSLGVQPIVYNDTPQAAIADRKAAQAAFSLKAGETSGPVQGDLGLFVLKVVGITPGHVASLEEARPKIEAEVRKAQAQAQVDAKVRKYEDARSGGANMIEAARQAGITPLALPPVTAQGQGMKGPAPAVAPKVLQTAFTLSAGQDSDIIDLGQGEYAAVQVDKVLPPATPSLDELRPQLTQLWMARDLETRLQAKASGLADQVRKGRSMEQVAASAGLAVSHGVGVERANAGQTFSQDLLAQLFPAKPGEVVVGPDVRPGPVVVARLQAVAPAAGPAAAQAAANQRPAMTRALLQDLGAAARAAARELVKPKVNYARARAAVGGDQGPAQ